MTENFRYPSRGRFESIFSDPSSCNTPAYDRILASVDECVAVPTRGSILPNWFLIIPNVPSINFSSWSRRTLCSREKLVQKFLAVLDIDYKRAIWFEHGPAHAGSIVGCGVDQAHLHVIVDAPFSFSQFFDEAVRLGSNLNWHPVISPFQNSDLGSFSSYLFAAKGTDGFEAQDVEAAGSQFFRRVIANLIDLPDAWDYRVHSHVENVHQTLAFVKQKVEQF